MMVLFVTESQGFDYILAGAVGKRFNTFKAAWHGDKIVDASDLSV